MFYYPLARGLKNKPYALIISGLNQPCFRLLNEASKLLDFRLLLLFP